MMVERRIIIIKGCLECKYRFSSISGFDCDLMNHKKLSSGDKVPEWCPLDLVKVEIKVEEI
ncbi:hypothetical protein KAR91_34490 [Candidatus Pacearchaeota archaeon]|nr:hypothetical protein [Candidatus Pacearchaeota archaeon]